MTAKTPEQLVSVYGDMVYRLAYAQTRSRHDADDIFQEVFLQTVRRHDTPLDDRIPFPEPEDSALDEALRRLTPKYRAAVHLFYYEGYTAEEIARMSGEKPSAIRTRLTRARAQLRELMKGELDDGFSQAVPQHE